MSTGGARVPEVRALHLRMLLDALPALGLERARAVEERIPAASLQRMRRGGRLAWLPARLLVDTCEAAAAVLDEDGLRHWGAAALQAAAGAPLTRAFFLAALGRERRDPGALLSFLFKAWPLLYRGCGDLHMSTREPGSARLLHGPTPAVLRRRSTVLPLVGALAAVPAHCGFEGAAEVSPFTVDTEWLTYVVTWRTRRER